MEQLQQIGLRHPVAELVRDIQNNRTGIPRRTFVAEGLFENNIVLQAGVAVETFLWCPEAAYSDESAKRSEELAARARRAYQISAKTLQRLAERPNPDGLISIARLPDFLARTDWFMSHRPEAQEFDGRQDEQVARHRDQSPEMTPEFSADCESGRTHDSRLRG